MPSLDFTLEQQRILDCTSENIIVSACAGSGKSSTLVEKAKREILLSRPWKKLAVLTFTNKSKDDLISKVNHPSIIITTFHGFIFENVFPFDPYFCNEVRESFQKRANTYIEWLDAFKNNKIIMGSSGKNDFVLQHALFLLNKINLKKFLKSKFHAVFIDEAQDNNIQQYSIVEFLINCKIKILMVGDPNQTLYGFRGACSETFKKYKDDSRFDSFILSENFRCHNIINEIAISYSFPDKNYCENGKGYIVTNLSKLDEIVERSLRQAAIWDEVKDRLHKSALGMSGGQQQRLCIARALAMQPEVLLMDEPTSALDPISTSKIEELTLELKKDYTIVIVTHNMQQAMRISDKTAFFLLGDLIEYSHTETLFSTPKEKKTEDYITGRFG